MTRENKEGKSPGPTAKRQLIEAVLLDSRLRRNDDFCRFSATMFSVKCTLSLFVLCPNPNDPSILFTPSVRSAFPAWGNCSKSATEQQSDSLYCSS